MVLGGFAWLWVILLSFLSHICCMKSTLDVSLYLCSWRSSVKSKYSAEFFHGSKSNTHHSQIFWRSRELGNCVCSSLSCVYEEAVLRSGWVEPWCIRVLKELSVVKVLRLGEGGCNCRFAKAPTAIRTDWNEFTKDYFLNRKTLVTVLLLVDACIPPQQIDLDCMDWLGQNKVSRHLLLLYLDFR